MIYLNLDLDYFSHPKTVRLIGLLGKGAEVLPLRLWCYCGKYHVEQGRLTGYSTQEIEAAVGWWGKPGDMVQAMVRVGFIEESNGEFVLHDWQDHEGHLLALKERGKTAAKARWDKARSSNATSNAREGAMQCSVPSSPSLPSQESPYSPPLEGQIDDQTNKKQKTTIPNWQDMIDHFDKTWTEFKLKKTGNAVRYPWPGKQDKSGQKIWGAIASRAKLYSPFGMMALWDLYLQMNDDWVRSTGYSIEAFLHKIPVLVDDPRWKSLASKHENRFLKPIESVGAMFRELGIPTGQINGKS